MMDGMKAVPLPRDRPHRTRVPQDRVRRQRHRSREPGYPRKSNLPGIQEIAWLVRDPCPQQSASSDPPANHSRDSHETRHFYTVWVNMRRHGNAMARPVYLQQRTYLVTAGMAVECHLPLADICGAANCSYSITSSARASNVVGTLRPSALAVLRLTTSSYLVGFCTGRSAGFSPLRMRST